MKSPIERCCRLLNLVAASLQSPFLLLVRLYWEWQFAQAEWGEVNNIAKVRDSSRLSAFRFQA